MIQPRSSCFVFGLGRGGNATKETANDNVSSILKRRAKLLEPGGKRSDKHSYLKYLIFCHIWGDGDGNVSVSLVYICSLQFKSEHAVVTILIGQQVEHIPLLRPMCALFDPRETIQSDFTVT